MKITFYGAVREVTGSMHMVSTDTDRVLLDCGMFQGKRRASEEKNRKMPVSGRDITNVVLSHAHIDHSGRIPLLGRKDFHGRVICTRATKDASEFLLLDSAHIQESDADYLNYKTLRSFLARHKTSKKKKRDIGEIKRLLKKGPHELDTETIAELMDRHDLETIAPLYSHTDAEHALSLFDGYPYHETVEIGKNLTVTFYDAGHILGSAISILTENKNGKKVNVCYTGDIGRFDKPILKNPEMSFSEEHRDIDLMIMESTYGNRYHEPVEDMSMLLKQVLIETEKRGGCVLIPSFAFGRTQELIYVIHELYNKNEVPRIPLYIDSPLATKLTKVFGEHPEIYDRQTHQAFLEKGENPFWFSQVRFVESVEESIALMREKTPHIVLSASGMCEAGRILHHLRYKIHNPANTILIVGYMAENTLGRRIEELGLDYEASGRKGSPPVVKFFNKEYPLKARVVKLGGFSAHGDRFEMTRFLKQSNLNIRRIALVHGEEDQSLSFARHLTSEGYVTQVPRFGDTVEVE